mmetsp:Transcript_203/g.806  ORF Transcript_203/g.806 Transcript_203/m.806 type:complete len:512 (-) Transcript_203:403-1938(-)
MVADVDHESALGHVDLVRAQQEHELLPLRDGLGRGAVAKIQGSHRGSGLVEDRDGVPPVLDRLAPLLEELLDLGHHGWIAVGSHQDQGPPRLVQGERKVGVLLRAERRSASQVCGRVGQVDVLAQHADGHALELGLPDPGVQHWGLHPWVGSHHQDHVRGIHARKGGVEEVGRPEVGVRDALAHILALHGLASETVGEVLQSDEGLAVGELAAVSGHVLPAHPLRRLRDGREGLLPLDGLQHASGSLGHGDVEPLPLQPVVLEPRLVRDPVLVNFFVVPGQDSEHLRAARVHANVAPEGIAHVHALRRLQLPLPGGKRVRLAGEGSHGAQVDNVAAQLGLHELVDVGSDLRGAAPAGDAQVLHPGHLLGIPHAPRAVNAAGHHRLDQRAQVLVHDSALLAHEPSSVASVVHGLVLKIALSTLVADRAVQRMVQQQELHHTFSCFFHSVRIRENRRPRGEGHGTRRNGLGRHAALVFQINQTHPAVASHRQLGVITKPRYVHPSGVASLHHA